MKIDSEIEEAKRHYLETVGKLGSTSGNRNSWINLRDFLYRRRALDLDVIIDDTTLREGLQMAGLAAPAPRDTCHIASLLMNVGVERVEVSTYTRADREAIRMMQDEGFRDVLAAWCRATKEDVDAALSLDFGQIGISHPVSYIHFLKWPGKSLRELIERVGDAVEYARSHGLRVFVHGEDSTRADWSFERDFIQRVADAGAEVYRICDTIGCGLSDPNAGTPNGIPDKIRKIRKETSIAYVEIHAHDDLGNAVENTMAAIRASSGLFEKVYASTTFLGIGDRSGNAETEKIIMNCHFHYGIDKWNLAPFRETAKFIASSLNYHLPLNKAIVGDAAFSHESGIHLQGIRILPLIYEAFPPEIVGHTRRIEIGKRSGKHGIQMKVEEITGRSVRDDDPRLSAIVEAIRDEYVNKGRSQPIGEEEFRRLVSQAGFDNSSRP